MEKGTDIKKFGRGWGPSLHPPPLQCYISVQSLMNHYHWELVFLFVWSFSTAEVLALDPYSEVLGVDPNSAVLGVDPKSAVPVLGMDPNSEVSIVDPKSGVTESKSRLVPEILSDNTYGVSLGLRQERH